MTESHHCAENALAERMNGILKQEYGLGLEFGIKADARRAVDQGVWLYNTQRPHTALDYQTPAQVHQAGLKPRHPAEDGGRLQAVLLQFRRREQEGSALLAGRGNA